MRLKLQQASDNGDRRWGWRLDRADGVRVASGEGYRSRVSCMRGIVRAIGLEMTKRLLKR